MLEHYWAEFDQRESRTAESMKQATASAVKGRAGLLASEQKKLDELKRALASLSPAERELPAFIGCNNTTATLCSPSDRSWQAASPVVTPNPNFFDTKNGAASVQLIVVRSGHAVRPVHDAWFHLVISDIWNTLDWSALEAQLNN
jgi:hypothetical protein